MAFGFTYTLPTLSAAHSAFVVALKTADFPSDALNGANAFDNGGGNLVAYTSSAKTTQLPVHVLSLVTGGSPSAEVYVRITPTATTGQTIYLEADAVQTSQPAPSSTYGRYNVWQDEKFATLCRDTTDLTGNSTGGFATGTATQTDDYYAFNGSSDYLQATLDSAINSTFTLRTIAQADTDQAANNRAISISDSSSTVSRAAISQNNVGAGEDFRYNPNVDGTNVLLDSSVGFNAGAKRWAAVVEQGSTREAFVDSVSRGTETTSLTLANLGADIFTLGNWVNSGGPVAGQYWDGRIYFGAVRLGTVTQAFLSDEFDNQSAATAWGTVGTWADSGGGPTYTLALDSGTHTLTGQSVGLTAQRTLALNTGSYALTGNDVSLLFNRSLAIDSGSYTLTGNDTTLLANRSLALDSGSYTVTGNAVDLVYTPISGPTYSLVMDTGNYSVTGQAAALIANRKLAPDSGPYSLTGQVVGFTYSGDLWNIQSDVVTNWTAESNVTTTWSAQSNVSTTWTIQE